MAMAVQERRRLTDLYKKGTLLSVEDPEGGDPIEVWISKLSPIQREKAGAKANGARAATLAIKRKPDEDESKLYYYDQFDTYGFNDLDNLIAYLISPEVQKLVMAHREEVAAKEEWSENNYIDSLQEAWNGGLDEEYEKDPEDSDAKRVHDELMRFSQEVQSLVESDTEGLRKDMRYEDLDKLKKDAIDRLIETEADYSWLLEFRRWQVYYCTRQPEDHKALYFENRGELDELDDKIYNQILEVFTKLNVDPIEGKDSEATPVS